MKIGVEKLDEATKRCLQTFKENIIKAEEAEKTSQQIGGMQQKIIEQQKQAQKEQQHTLYAPKAQQANVHYQKM